MHQSIWARASGLGLIINKEDARVRLWPGQDLWIGRDWSSQAAWLATLVSPDRGWVQEGSASEYDLWWGGFREGPFYSRVALSLLIARPLWGLPLCEANHRKSQSWSEGAPQDSSRVRYLLMGGHRVIGSEGWEHYQGSPKAWSAHHHRDQANRWRQGEVPPFTRERGTLASWHWALGQQSSRRDLTHHHWHLLQSN